ncbi:hypothetical protein [Singulisphaera sp. Ch08]|uniref:hypothetical protein n=1 Tax=Singulisphaera sp. Ch08 TaxID=3120278 RepID=UPI003872EBDF
MAARASDVGSSEVETEIEYDGPDLPVTYDPKFLLEPLGSMGDEVTTTLQISRKAATLLQTEDGFRGLVMPMSRDR